MANITCHHREQPCDVSPFDHKSSRPANPNPPLPAESIKQDYECTEGEMDGGGGGDRRLQLATLLICWFVCWIGDLFSLPMHKCKWGMTATSYFSNFYGFFLNRGSLCTKSFTQFPHPSFCPVPCLFHSMHRSNAKGIWQIPCISTCLVVFP